MDRLTLFLISILLLNVNTAQAEPTFSVETEKGSYLLYKSSHALVIGVEKYKFWNNLDSIPKDIDDVKNALIEQGFDVKTVLNPDGKELRTSVEQFLLSLKGSTEDQRESRLLVYFAGHGATDNGYTGYLIPTDAPASHEDADFIRTALGMDIIKTWASRSRAKHILFVFDSCYSGAVFYKRGNLKPRKELFVRDLDQPTRFFITAGSKDEEVPAISDFTPAFIRGLRGEADLYEDGLVTSAELGYWLKAEISQKGKQTPQYGTIDDSSNNGGEVVFSYSTKLPRVALSSDESQSHIDTQSESHVQTISLSAYHNLATITRGETTRSIGEPSDPRGNVFRGIKLYYYQKIDDGEKILESLDKGGIPYLTTRAQLPAFKTNTIACGPDTPVEAIKVLARALINNGINLQAIVQFREPKKKHGRIELLAMSKDAKGKEEMTSPPLTIEQIDKLEYCPGRLINSVNSK